MSDTDQQTHPPSLTTKDVGGELWLCGDIGMVPLSRLRAVVAAPGGVVAWWQPDDGEVKKTPVSASTGIEVAQNTIAQWRDG